jgi:hypothetical protein
MIQYAENKSPLIDDVYQYLVKDYEYAKAELDKARQKEYAAWKKILEHENKHFGTNHPV